MNKKMKVIWICGAVFTLLAMLVYATPLDDYIIAKYGSRQNFEDAVIAQAEAEEEQEMFIEQNQAALDKFGEYYIEVAQINLEDNMDFVDCVNVCGDTYLGGKK